MKVEITGSQVKVINDDGKKFRTESAFWYALKKCLHKQGLDLVKKVMSKDGHMVGGDTYPYYLRDRKWKYCIHDSDYAIRQVHQAFNSGFVYLKREDWK